MNINSILTEEDPGKWYPIKGFSKVKVKIRNLKPKERTELGEQCTRERMRRGRIEETIDTEALNKLLLDRCVVDWENIEDNDGPMECNFENKMKLNENWLEFSELWNGVYLSGETNTEDIKEALVKN